MDLSTGMILKSTLNPSFLYVVELLSLSDQSVKPSKIPPSKPLLKASPTQEREFPVLVFLHGYLLNNSFYFQLIQHISTHRFNVVAPQALWDGRRRVVSFLGWSGSSHLP
ncbi:hypothetical protein Syun_007201 [Stephania yunnanensis]|uniref:1-alkyl-2-acetylglycerophosphocholine esterase n=1 Tax=Stephania yunnanensis TaxID=152371 RepID=A0AAP0L0N5_9MAGN